MSQQTQDGEQASLGYCELLASRRARPHRNKAEDSRCSCTPADGCGEACTNQRLQQRSGIACSLRYMPGKGWGVVADHPVGQNTLVVEYCGEVVSRAEGTRRAAAYAARGLRHTYIMGLSSDEVIDATVHGNMARFINHSCAPNCVSQVWHIHGEPHVGIFTLRHIGVGEELTYSYNLALPGETKPTRCLCGAACCRQMLGTRRSVARPPPGSDRSSDTHVSSSDDEYTQQQPRAVPRMRRSCKARRQALRWCRLMRVWWPSSRGRSRLRPMPVDDGLDDFASGCEADAKRVALHRLPRRAGACGVLLEEGPVPRTRGHAARRRQLQRLRLRLEEQEEALLATGLQAPRGTRAGGFLQQVSQLQTLDSDVEGRPRTRQTLRRGRPSLFCHGWAPLPCAQKVYPPSMVPVVAALQYFLKWRAQLVQPSTTLGVVQLSLGLV